MVRVLSNYMRLALTFGLGIIVVRMMAEIGADAVLIYLLLISSGGITAMFKFALQNALVPALGLSIDNRTEHGFSKVLWTSFVFGLGSGLVSLVLFGVFWVLSEQLNFGALSPRTIAVALAGTALQAFSSSIGIVFLNVILVERRIVTFNVIQTLDRAFIFLAAVVVFLLPFGTTVDTKVQVFYAVGSVLVVLLQIATYLIAIRGRPDLRLRREALSAGTTRWIGLFVGWNIVVVIAFAFFTRWPTLVVNWSMGEAMTLTISIALTVIGYQRQLSMGLVVGLDAMVARLLGADNSRGQDSANALILRSTYILSVFSAASVCALCLFIQPILALWLGDTLASSGWTPETTATLFRIMSIGIAASILSEGWMKFLSGRGEVNAYAPALLVAGILNIAGVLLAVTLFEGETALLMIAIVFSVSFLAVNFGFIAIRMARRLGLSVWRFYAVIAIPMCLIGLCAVPGVFMLSEGWQPFEMIATFAILLSAALLVVLTAPRVLAKLGH